jgi:hypothetical protein
VVLFQSSLSPEAEHEESPAPVNAVPTFNSDVVANAAESCVLDAYELENKEEEALVYVCSAANVLEVYVFGMVEEPLI